MNELMVLFEKNLLEHFLEQEAVSDKRKEEDYDEVGIVLRPPTRGWWLSE